jgi:hypothetical protein
MHPAGMPAFVSQSVSLSVSLLVHLTCCLGGSFML